MGTAVKPQGCTNLKLRQLMRRVAQHYDAEVGKTGSTYDLVKTHGHNQMEGRGLVRYASAEEYASNSHFAHEGHEEPEQSMYPGYKYDRYSWGLAINPSSCP